MAMPASTNSQQPLFTIEQIELIRRLRNSGLTKEQLGQAFDSMDRLDRELGPTYSLPMSTLANQIIAAANQMSLARSNIIGATPTQWSGMQNVPVTTPSRKRSYDNVVDASEEISNGSHDDVTEAHSGGSNLNAQGIDEEVPEEDIRDFASKGDIVCFEEIRSFVSKYQIRQAHIAAYSGISQAYVSRYLRGDFFDMSEKAKGSVFKWYLVCKKNLNAMLNMQQTSQSFGAGGKKVMLTDTGEVVPWPRRERFTFRPVHLEVLEAYFTQDSYPSSSKREQIANACNSAVAIPGREMNDKEKVSPQIVANWFANRRKEVKKMAREEGIKPAQISFLGRGRPRKNQEDPYAVYKNTAQMSPDSPRHTDTSEEDSRNYGVNGSGNNHHDDPQALHAAYLGLERSRKSVTDSSQHLSHSQTSVARETNGDHGDSEHVQEVYDDDEHAEDHNEHNSSHGSGYNDEQFVAEVAAVNRAILELSGKAPTRSIKVEKEDSSYGQEQ